VLLAASLKVEAPILIEKTHYVVDRWAMKVSKCAIDFVVGGTDNDQVCQLLQDAIFDDVSLSLTNRLVV